MRGIFSCSECETVLEDGSHFFKGVVLHGTETGVLSKLPDFNRPSVVVEPVTGTAPHQFLIPISRFRRVLDSIYRAALASSDESDFECISPDGRSIESIESQLYPRGDSNISMESAAIKDLLFVSYKEDSIADLARRRRRRASTSSASQPNSGDDITSVTGNRRRRGSRKFNESNNARVQHKLLTPNLRAAVADFGWGFCAASIPSVVLTSKKREAAAENVASLLNAYRICSHDHCQSRNPCDSCANELTKNVLQFSDTVLTAANLAIALAAFDIRRNGEPIRNIARIAATILQASV